MDYGFAPGGTDYDEMARLLLDRMNIELIHQEDIRDIEGFIRHLETSIPNNKKPIGNLFIASHGNSSGWMAIDLDKSTKNPNGTEAKDTTYDVLIEAVKIENKTVQIPKELHCPEGDPCDDPVEFDVHIRGCRIGQSEPFVKKLKEAFHSPRSVTAPKHFHFTGPVREERDEYFINWGSFEYLAYSFDLFRPHVPGEESKVKRLSPNVRQFLTKKEVVDALVERTPPCLFIDGEEVPRSLWQMKGLIPDKPDNVKKESPMYLTHHFKLGLDIGLNITTFPLKYEFRHEKETYPFDVPGIDTDPVTNAAKREKLRDAIENDEHFQEPPDYPFPDYMAYGYASAKDFIDGLTWHCNWNKEDEKLECIGTRHVYTIVVPIVDPPIVDPANYHSSHNLLFNLYPVAGSGLVRDHHPIKHTDPKFFLTV